MKEFIKNMLSADSAISCKRVSGILGWLSFIGIVIYCSITKSEAPNITELMAICSSALIGLDSITSIWKK